MDLRLRVRAQNDIITLEVSGEIDLHSAPQLRAELVNVTEGSVPRIVVDLAEVTFIDSTGIGAIVGGLKRAREKGGTLVFANAQQRVHRVFEITGLLQALPLYQSRDAAIAAVAVAAAEAQSSVTGGTDGR